MYKSGLLPAPVIQPLKYDSIGSKLKVGPNTYIQIKSGTFNKIHFSFV